MRVFCRLSAARKGRQSYGWISQTLSLRRDTKNEKKGVINKEVANTHLFMDGILTLSFLHSKLVSGLIKSHLLWSQSNLV